ncbi:MAG: spermidine/putrescine ABC transporter substrate-binding protein [Rhabdochlamydiaceae bacterium]|nr:spermidine/putrescine ABC transporter substrate-binding protein [Candidatus Amphrikana amoebophyrae]
MTKKTAIRTFVIFIWVALLMSLLHLPKLFDQSSERTLNIFTWGDYFESDELIETFEKRTGIKIKFHFYSANEELRVKLLSNKGKYDLVIPSDYAVKRLIKENALKPLDHSKLTFMDKILPQFKNLYYDPGNVYSIPNTWESYGLGYNKKDLEGKTILPSLSSIFDESVIDYKFAMPCDPGESIIFATTYLFGRKNRINQAEAKQVTQLLIQQKKHVEAYSDYRSKYLIQTRNCPIALVRASLVWQIAKESNYMGYMQPKEATFVTVENLVIPKETLKDDLIYEFINYLYEPKSQALQVGPAPVYPVIKEAMQYLTEEVDEYHKDFQFSLNNAANFIFFKRLLSEEETRNLWVDVKSTSES